MSDLTLQSDTLKVTFDQETGCLTGMEHLRTGLRFQTESGFSENWRLSIPLKHDWPYMVFGRGSKVSIERQGTEAAAFTWDGVEVEGKPCPIRLIARVKVVGDDLECVMTVENQSPYKIDYVWYPILAGVRQLYPGEADDLLAPYLSGALKPQADIYNQEWQDRGGNRYWYHCRQMKFFSYPQNWFGMQWMDLYNANGKGGLYLTSRDNDRFCTFFAFEHERAATPMTIALVKAPFLDPGESAAGPANVFSLHEGDWHTGARKYRDWMLTWCKRKERAEWVRNLDGWLAVQGHVGDYHIEVSYEDYPDWYEKAKSIGLNTLHLHCGVHEQGIEGGNPYWNDWSERMGGKETLMRSIEEIHARGGHIVSFAKENKVNTGLPEFFSRFYHHAIKLRDGGIPHRNYPIGTIDMQLGTAYLACMCRAHEKWHDFIVPILEDLATTGLDGVMLDEWCSGLFFCFDPNHTHKKPSDQWAGQLELGRKIAAAWRRHNPEHLLAAEEIWDAAYEFMDLSFARGYPSDYGQVYRYALPWIQRTAELLENDYDYLNHAFACGFIFAFCFDDYHSGPEAYPEYAAYIREVVRIRGDVRRYFLDGEFHDTLIHRLEGDPEIVARTYRLDGKDLVAVYNRRPEPGTFILTLDGLPREWTIREPGKANRTEKAGSVYKGRLEGHRMAVLECKF